MNYKSVSGLELEARCSDVTLFRWTELMKGHTRANKKEIDRLVKEFLPDLHYDLALDFYNPYNYYKTKTHLILVHSATEYFLRFYK